MGKNSGTATKAAAGNAAKGGHGVSEPRLVVGVGASAGGLEAFKQLLAALPNDTGMAFLLVQHLDPTHRSLLTELLAPLSSMKVLEAAQGARLEADTIYVIPPDTALGVRGGRISLTSPTLHRGVRLPVDHLFRSLAREYGSRAVGVVLSGAGSDGSSGLRDLKGGGGLTIAQRPGASLQTGMPQSAIDTGLVDLVLDIGEVPAALERYASLPPEARSDVMDADVADNKGEHPMSLDDAQLARLAALFEAHEDFDLSVYKSGTVERRLIRRVALAGLDNPEAYFDRLRHDAAERQALVRDLLISVTEFFRDADAFQALRELAIEPMVAAAAPRATLRVWVPGCASGEEAYSIAIELLEAIEASPASLALQVFATDIDQDALAIARSGIYPPTVAERVSKSRLERYFKAHDGKGFQVRPQLRDAISFAVHDLTKDAPFSRMDLVSCRNVLIYLRPEAQQHVLKSLHFALNAERYLLLGPSESTTPQRDLFSTVSKKWRLYRKLGESRPMAIRRTSTRPSAERADTAVAAASDGARASREAPRDLARKSLLDARVPPSVIVAADGTVRFTHGELRPFLRIPEGDYPRVEFSSLVAPELATRTRAALYKCRRDGETVTALSATDGLASPRVRVTVSPADHLGSGFVIVSFENVPSAPSEPDGVADDQAHQVVLEQLEKELQATREDLRSTVEELETSNEELRSANEESTSMNEELQSANEELEATTEELRSLNEELTTVNAQLREKVDQLEQAHDDLSNLFASTKIAALFLDERLCIKRFTPAAGELLRLDGTDNGRFIGDINRGLLQGQLIDESKHVLEHLATQARELQTEDGAWIIRRVLPYRTENRRIEGVVVTLVDVSELKQATATLAIRERQQAALASLTLAALKDEGLSTFLTLAARVVRQTLGVDACEVLERLPDGRLVLRAGIGWEEAAGGAGCAVAEHDSLAAHTLDRGEVVVVQDLAADGRVGATPAMQARAATSAISGPVGAGSDRYGVIGAYAGTRRAFSAEDVHFVQSVSGVISNAVTRHYQRSRSAVEAVVARAMGEATTLADVAQRTFQCLGQELGVVVGQLWVPQASSPTLGCAEKWHTERGDEEPLKRFSSGTVSRGDGLIGRAWEQRRALWAGDGAASSDAQRGSAARELGIRSGIALPVVAHGDVVAVLAAFAKSQLPAGDALIKMLGRVGQQLGDFVVHAALEDKAQRLAAITESAHDAIVSYGFDGTVAEWLQGASALYGFGAEEMVGQPVTRVIPEDRIGEWKAALALVQQGAVVPAIDTDRVRKDGVRISVSVRMSAIRNRSGSVVGAASTDRDVTAQKQVEQRLRGADRQKDEFLAMLGHELRNPLGAIRTAASLLHEKELSPILLQRAREVLDRQSQHIATLVDSLLDVSRIARGRIEIEHVPTDLASICSEVTEDVRLRQASNGIRLTCDRPEGAVWVTGDSVRLAQVVDNLLSNAVKFTPAGGSVRLRLTVEGGQARVSIKDTGIGIPAELLPEVFQVFRQGRQTLDRSLGGLGLGLALCKALVELHDGTITAHSEGQGMGSEFVVQLRLCAAPSAQPELKPELMLRRVLIVDDNTDFTAVLSAILEHQGHHVWAAANGAQALALAAEHAPEVVLCDLGLPGMSGFELVRALRQQPAMSDAFILALTGYGRPEDIERSLAAGFDLHVSKPVATPRLAELISRGRQSKGRA